MSAGTVYLLFVNIMPTKRTYLLQILLLAFLGESVEAARVGFEQTHSNAQT